MKDLLAPLFSIRDNHTRGKVGDFPKEVFRQFLWKMAVGSENQKHC
jgi:hypothetical protein